MVDSTMDVSSPGYFSRTFGVNEALAADLSRQAGVARNGGGGLAAEASRVVTPAAPSSAPSAPAPPVAASPSALSARAEYDQIMSDRTSGKINAAQWNSTYAARERALAELIAKGSGASPAPTAAAPVAETHPYLGAPQDGDYGLLRDAGDIPEDQVAQITATQQALGRLNLSRSVVQDVHDRLRTFTAEMKDATPEQVNARFEANYTRFTQMVAREGISAAQAESLIGNQLREWSAREPAVREMLRSIVTIGDPLMLDYILQIAIHSRGGRR
jgi:hypothetical protein